MKLLERIEVLRSLVWEVQTYQDILEYLSYDLNSTPSRINENEGLYFIWRSIMALQILTLSKLIKGDGAFSFQKLINIASSSIDGFNTKHFQDELELMKSELSENKLDVVRDKFIAHLDINSTEIKTDIHTLCIKSNQCELLFNDFAKALNVNEYSHKEDILNGVKSVFDELDEYSRIKALLMAAEVNGIKQVKMKDIINAVENAKPLPSPLPQSPPHTF